MNIKEKLKTIFLKTKDFILNWSKKHKILAFIICLYLIVKAVTFPVYLYKYFRYGHFEKVIEYTSDESTVPSIYEATQTLQYNKDTIIEKGTLLFFQTNVYNNPAYIKIGNKAFRQMGNFLTYKKYQVKDDTAFQVFNKDTDFVFYQATKNEHLYKIDTKHKKLIPIETETNNFEKANVKPILFENKPCFLDYFYRLDGDNLLYAYYYRDGDNVGYRYARVSTKDNKQYEIDASEFEYDIPIQLSSNKYLFISRGPTFAPLEYIGVYELVNDKFKKLDIPLPKNYNKYTFSIDNPLVLDEDHVIFVGGDFGARIFGWWTKKCYLYDIKKAKFIKINDFPRLIGYADFLKTSNGENYIYYTYYIDEDFGKYKYLIYKYKK